MTPAMKTALRAPSVMIAGLVRIALADGHVIRLCDGSISIAWGDEVFTGRDPIYGAIDQNEDISEEVGDTIPGATLTLDVPTLEAVIALCAPANQGAPARFWLAIVDRDTGMVVPDPDLQFAGEIDTADHLVDRGVRKVKLGIDSVWARLLEPDEGANHADSFHRSIFPGERGLANMTSTTISELWGPGDRPPAVTQPPAVSQGGANRYF